jgi:hypothetical protein
MKAVICTILFIFLFGKSHSQVINVETLRKVTDSAKWTGSVSLDVSLIKNKNHIFKIANKAHVQYNNKKNLWLFINDLKFEKLEGSAFVNKGTQHFRYNRKISEIIKLEGFLQAQYDAVSEIDFRGLAGLGPRFKLYGNDNYRFYLGTLVMYEYEKASDVENEIVRETIRGSAYVSFSMYPTEYLSIISTSYYQPRLSAFGDFRLSTDTAVLFKIFATLAFKTNFTYSYDVFPVATIPKTQYELTNGLLYTF